MCGSRKAGSNFRRMSIWLIMICTSFLVNPERGVTTVLSHCSLVSYSASSCKLLWKVYFALKVILYVVLVVEWLKTKAQTEHMEQVAWIFGSQLIIIPCVCCNNEHCSSDMKNLNCCLPPFLKVSGLWAVNRKKNRTMHNAISF